MSKLKILNMIEILGNAHSSQRLMKWVRVNTNKPCNKNLRSQKERKLQDYRQLNLKEAEVLRQTEL